MTTIRHEERPMPVMAIVSLGLAECAALSLVLSDAVLRAVPDSDGLIILFFVLGWVLMAWATIGVVVALVHLLRAGDLRRRPALVECAFVLAAVVVLVGTACTYPLIGAGSGAA
jgi:hypothetical protein